MASSSRLVRRLSQLVDLCGHDEIILVQSLDLFGSQGNGRVAPAEIDIPVMPFGFSNLTDLLHERQGFSEVPKPESTLDPMCVVDERPFGRLPGQELRQTVGEGRVGPADQRQPDRSFDPSALEEALVLDTPPPRYGGCWWDLGVGRLFVQVTNYLCLFCLDLPFFDQPVDQADGGLEECFQPKR
jgi:hypothetical protein